MPRLCFVVCAKDEVTKWKSCAQIRICALVLLTFASPNARLLPLLFRHITLFSLFLLLVFQQTGYWVGYRFLKARVKSKMQILVNSKMQLDDVSVFEFDLTAASQINWREGKHEFVQNGQWYDLVKTHQNGNCIVIYALNDKREKALEDGLFASFCQNNAQAARSVLLILAQTTTLFCLPSTIGILGTEQVFLDMADTSGTFVVVVLPQAFPDCPAPPPKVF